MKKRFNMEREFRKQWQAEAKFYDKLTERMRQSLIGLILSSKTNKQELLNDAKINFELRRLQKRFELWLNKNIPLKYKRTYRQYLLKGAKPPTNFNRKTAISTNILIEQALADMAKAVLKSKRELNKLAQLVRERNILATKQNVLDEVTVNLQAAYSADASQLVGRSKLYTKLVKAVGEGNTLPITGKDGIIRRYKVKSYAATVARTKYVEAHTVGTMDVAKDFDTDLVQCSDHNTTTEYDKQFEGRVFSISGTHPRFPKLVDSPPFHPNCLHFINPIFEDAYTEKELQELEKVSKINPKGATGNG